MSAAFKWGFQPCFQDCQGEFLACDAASDYQDVGVVVRSTHSSMEFGGTQRCPYSLETVRRHGHTKARAAYQNASGHLSSLNP